MLIGRKAGRLTFTVSHYCFYGHISNMEGKSSTQRGAVFFLSHFLSIVWVECPKDSEFDFFDHQIIPNLPWSAIDIPRFLKYLRNLGFLKKDGFFQKKFLNFFPIGRGGKFAAECVSNDNMS